MSFTRLAFEEVFADESGGNVKTPQGEYLAAGSLPVVDQGKALIGGYVNDGSRLCGGGRPAIVFGDHTRCVKYVGFPFCMGADGVKVLRPKIDADLKYLYHYLQTIELPDGGYDRHYKYLKRTEVVIPPVSEQRRIAAILDKADALRAKRREALSLLDELQQGIFIEMFGDPVANLRDWEMRPLEAVCNKITDGTHKTPVYVHEGIEFLSAKDLKNGRVQWGSGKFISEDEHAELIRRCNPEIGDLLLAKSGSLGTVAVIDRSHEFSLFESLCLIKHDRKMIDGQFLAGLLRVPSMQAHLLGKNKGVAIKHLHLVDVRGLMIPTPPIELQKIFASRVSVLKQQASLYFEGLVVLNGLFASIQHYAFRGAL